ncbi:PACE efflux transporter [Moritella dasanensis]|uniref:PACE efflux transporter n=1 Tax=Moritella dasanensis TaxID=428031 RepID=UPI00031EAD84|nr:PACE efflux transporter [Moritella dasanensis]
MSTKERIFHSLLFEIIALAILLIASKIFTQQDTTTVGGVAITLSLIAMAWNYVYNLGFDNLFGADRLSRKLMMRIGHGLGFEAGLIFATIPVLMWILQLDFMTVLILDLGLVMFFLIYSIIFNWCYDNTREKLKSPLAVA